MSNRLMERLHRIKSKSKVLLGFVTWIAGIVASFVAAPAIVSNHINIDAVKGLANLILALIVSTFLFFTQKAPSVSQRRLCFSLCWLFLLGGSVSYYFYNRSLDLNTMEWPPGKPPSYVTGSHYCDTVYKIGKQENFEPEKVDKAVVVRYFTPRTLTDFEVIWPVNEILNNGLRIIGLYFLVIVLFACFILLVIYSAE